MEVYTEKRGSSALSDGTWLVGSFKPNAFGLYDTTGHIWCWTQDCWNSDFTGVPTDGSAWEKGDVSKRVCRGGGWSRSVETMRAASRVWGASGHSVGGRVARAF
jgi:formylglycine-generating enzyme required for sulfatase activity